MSGAGKPEGVSIGLSRRYRVFRRMFVALVGALLGLRVYGSEYVPGDGPLVVASNHRQYLDPVYICMAVPRRIQWMGKKELFIFPFRRFFYLIGSFPVDRQKGGRAALRTALRYLEMGAALGIFPEGTRRKDDDPKSSPKNGTVMLAARSGAPVLPVHVGPAPGPLQRIRGRRLEVHIGRPQAVGEGRGSYREDAERIVEEIYALPGEGE